MTNIEERNGKLVIVSGPSGVGKSTISKRVAQIMQNVYLSISYTTRPKSEEEVDGRDYRFISREEFERLIEKDLMLEYAEVYGNLYGTPKNQIEQALEEGKVVLLEIDVQGAKQVKQIYPEAIMVFIVPPTQKELAERMKNRGRDGAQAAKQRLDGSSIEIAAAWEHYQHIVINDTLEQAVKEIVGIIKDFAGENT